MLVKAFNCGADGAIGIGYNFAGEWAREIYDAVQEGDQKWAEQNQDVFREFWKVVFELPHGLGGPGKYLTLSMRGLDLGPLRWPQVALSEQGRVDTDKYVKPIFKKCYRKGRPRYKSTSSDDDPEEDDLHRKNVKVQGVRIYQNVKIANEKLQLIGVGINNTTGIICQKVYVCAMYVKSLTIDWEYMIKSDEPSSFQLTVLPMVSTGTFMNSLDNGFISANGQKSHLNEMFDEFKKSFVQSYRIRVKQGSNEKVKLIRREYINMGDQFAILYTPERGTEVYRNGSLTGQIDGLEFKQALWSTWLGKNPVNFNLRKEILGK